MDVDAAFAPDDGFWLLPVGRSSSSPAALFERTTLKTVVAELRERFDYVVIDGPPITEYPDSAQLAAAAGSAILVVRAERTLEEVAARAVRTFESSGAQMLGAVLNRQRSYLPSWMGGGR